MDEQKPTDEQNGSGPGQNSGTTFINDITPPPAPKQTEEQDTASEPITVRVTTENVVQDQSDVVAEPTEEVVSEMSTADEATSPRESAFGTEEVVADTVVSAPFDEQINQDEPTNEQAEDMVEQNEAEAYSPEAIPVSVEEGENTASVEMVPEISSAENGEPSNEQSNNRLPTMEAMATVGVASSQMNKAPHRNNKKLAAIITLVVAVILAGVAVFVYMSANSNTAEDTTAGTTEDTTTAAQKEVSPATTTDIDQTNTNVDEALKSVDEATDFAESDLSDASLGL